MDSGRVTRDFGVAQKVSLPFAALGTTRIMTKSKARPQKKRDSASHSVHETPGFTRESDFTGGNVASEPIPDDQVEQESFKQRIQALVSDWNCAGNEEYVAELISTVLKLGHDGASTAEMKLISRSLKEMRRSNNVFRPHQHCRKVAVFGSARTKPDEPEYEAAEEFAYKMVDHGFMSITGAGPGIMEAAQKGATAENSFGLQIRLPFEEGANQFITEDEKLINFNYFFTRKLAFVKEANAAALFPGGFGTMDEGFEVLTLIQTGKAIIFPVVMIDAPGGSYWKTYLQFIKEHLFRLGLISEQDFSLFKITDDVDEAVREIVTFYKVFNSYRYVREKLVIRLNKKLTSYAVDAIQDEFGDILHSGKFVQGEALREERDEVDLAKLPRLIFHVDRRQYGRIRQLIDAINLSETED